MRSLPAAGVLEAMVFGVPPQEPLVIVGAAGLLRIVVGAATLVPARRASRIPPSVPLRSE